MKYFNELKRSMNYIASHPDTIFIGQAVADPGTAMSNTLKEINKNKLFETPVFEEMQMGISIGYALNGIIPVCIFPRWNFLLLASNQIINHLDKIKTFSNNGFNPKVIIRTSIGSINPLDPQAQHKGDFTNAFKQVLTNIDIIKLSESNQIFEAYKYAYERHDGKSTIIVEYGDFYNEK